MAKNTKDGTDSKEAKDLKKAMAETEKRQEEREAEMKAVEAEKLEAAKAESDDQTEPVAKSEPLPKGKREAAWQKLQEAYAEQNPVKYAQKKKAGAFDVIPDSFTGINALNIKG